MKVNPNFLLHFPLFRQERCFPLNGSKLLEIKKLIPTKMFSFWKFSYSSIFTSHYLKGVGVVVKKIA